MNLPTIDYSRKWHVMAAVGMGVFLATIDGSIVNIALPSLVTAFKTDFSHIQWVVLAYLLTVTTLMLSVGRLADMRGKKPIYTAGFVVFTVGSVLCGLSPNVYALIGFRVLQAVGAAMVMSLGTAIITEAFPASERGRALGISGAIVSVGIATGPTLGGILLQNFSWHWIFFVNLPVGIFGTWMVTRYVPASQPRGGQRFDYWGAVTLCVALLALLFAMTTGETAGFTNPLVFGLLALWLVFQTIFIRTELRVPQPMIDLRLFNNALFSVNVATGVLSFVCFSGTFILMPFYLQNILHYEPRQAGLLLSVVPIALGLTSPVSGWLSDRFGPRLIATIGLFILALGFFLLSSLETTTSALGFGLRFLPVGLGMGIFSSPNNSAIMGTAPRERLGVVSGLLAVNRTIGQTMGISILGAVWATRVAFYEGIPLTDGATSASAISQVAGMQDTFLIITALIGFAFALSLWALRKASHG
jgi:EmrB/QacA subfamily drug resistance transporter